MARHSKLYNQRTTGIRLKTYKNTTTSFYTHPIEYGDPFFPSLSSHGVMEQTEHGDKNSVV